VIETVPHLPRCHRRHPRGRQFDCQRDTVEASADLDDRASLIRLVQREARRDAAGAFNEQFHCGRVDSRADVQRGHRPQLLVGDPQALAAGGHDSHRRRLRHDGFDQIGGGVEHVLAVVEHQQADSALQRGRDTLGHTLARLLGDAQHRRHRIGHRSRISDRSQLEKPDAVGKFIGQTRRDLGG
jgi:hypothetical protein